MPDVPSTGRVLRSTITSDGRLRLSVEQQPVTAPRDGQVIVAVEATPINPSDLGVLLATADPSTLTPDGDDLVGAVPPAALPILRDRLDKPLAVGNEGAGTVVAAGPGAEGLVGKRVAMFGGSMWSDYRVADAAGVVELPEGATAAEGASLFVNPMTALAMVETMRAERHTALVHTAAASNLGRMLVAICRDDGIPLVNIVRRPEQRELLAGLGAEQIVDSSEPDFADRLAEAVAATGATLAFDAIGGGTLAGDILAAMERVQPPADHWTPYGSTTHKQVYIYGSLDFGPTVVHRTFGLHWGIGGFLLTSALGLLGGEVIGRMRARIIAEMKTTFASEYAETIGLGDVLQLDTLGAIARRGTGSKYLIDPSRDHPG